MTQLNSDPIGQTLPGTLQGIQDTPEDVQAWEEMKRSSQLPNAPDGNALMDALNARTGKAPEGRSNQQSDKPGAAMTFLDSASSAVYGAAASTIRGLSYVTPYMWALGYKDNNNSSLLFRNIGDAIDEERTKPLQQAASEGGSTARFAGELAGTAATLPVLAAGGAVPMALQGFDRGNALSDQYDLQGYQRALMVGGEVGFNLIDFKLIKGILGGAGKEVEAAANTALGKALATSAAKTITKESLKSAAIMGSVAMVQSLGEQGAIKYLSKQAPEWDWEGAFRTAGIMGLAGGILHAVSLSRSSAFIKAHEAYKAKLSEALTQNDLANLSQAELKKMRSADQWAHQLTDEEWAQAVHGSGDMSAPDPGPTKVPSAADMMDATHGKIGQTDAVPQVDQGDAAALTDSNAKDTALLKAKLAERQQSQQTGEQLPGSTLDPAAQEAAYAAEVERFAKALPGFELVMVPPERSIEPTKGVSPESEIQGALAGGYSFPESAPAHAGDGTPVFFNKKKAQAALRKLGTGKDGFELRPVPNGEGWMLSPKLAPEAVSAKEASTAGVLTSLKHGSPQTNLSELAPSKYGDFGSGVYLSKTDKLANLFANGAAKGIRPKEKQALGHGEGRVYDVELVRQPTKPFVEDNTPLTKEEIAWWKATDDSIDEGVTTRSDLFGQRTGRNLGSWDNLDWKANSSDWDAFLTQFGYDAVVSGDEVLIRDSSLVRIVPKTPEAPSAAAPKSTDKTPLRSRRRQSGMTTLPNDFINLVVSSVTKSGKWSADSYAAAAEWVRRKGKEEYYKVHQDLTQKFGKRIQPHIPEIYQLAMDKEGNPDLSKYETYDSLQQAHKAAVEDALKSGRMTADKADQLGHFTAYPELAKYRQVPADTNLKKVSNPKKAWITVSREQREALDKKVSDMLSKGEPITDELTKHGFNLSKLDTENQKATILAIEEIADKAFNAMSSTGKTLPNAEILQRALELQDKGDAQSIIDAMKKNHPDAKKQLTLQLAGSLVRRNLMSEREAILQRPNFTEADAAELDHNTEQLVNVKDEVQNLLTTSGRSLQLQKVIKTLEVQASQDRLQKVNELIQNPNEMALKRLKAMEERRALEAGLSPTDRASIAEASRTQKNAEVFLAFVRNNILSRLSTSVYVGTTSVVGTAMMDTTKAVGGALQGAATGDFSSLRTAANTLAYYRQFHADGLNALVAAFKNGSAHGGSEDFSVFPHLNDPDPYVRAWANAAYKMTGMAIGTRLIAGVTAYCQNVKYRSLVAARAYGEAHGTLSEADIQKNVQSALANAFDEKGNPTDQFAWHEAQTGTADQPLRANTRLSDLAADGHETLAKHPFLAALFLPFNKSPINDFYNGLRMTPILQMASARYRREIMGWNDNGNIPDRVVKERQAMAVGQTVVGWAALGGLYALAESNRITGNLSNDESKRREQMKLGIQPYSIRLLNPLTGKETWISYRRGFFGPLATAMGIMADVKENWQELNQHDIKAAAATAFFTIRDNALSLPFMTSLSNLTDALKDDTGFKVENLFGQGVRNLVPMSGLLKSVATGGPDLVSDPIQRSANGFMQQVMQDIPLVRNQLEPRLNRLGEPQEFQKLPYGFNILVPVRTSDVLKDPVLAKLGELQLTLPNKDNAPDVVAPFSAPSPMVFNNQIDLRTIKNGDGKSAYLRYRELIGTTKVGGMTLRDQLGKLFESPEFKKGGTTPDESYMTGQQVMTAKILQAYDKAAFANLRKEFPILNKLDVQNQVNRAASQSKAYEGKKQSLESLLKLSQ